jgi:hypothetical protein
MAKCKFKAAQFYKISNDKVAFQFNYFGEYATDHPDELEVLHSLVGSYVQEVEHFEEKEKVEDKAPEKDEPEIVEDKAEEKEVEEKEEVIEVVKAEEKKPKRSSKK